MARSKHYVIATQGSYLQGTFPTKASAVRALAHEVKASTRECRQRRGRCSVIGSARQGSVQIKIGGRQGYNLWQRYVIVKR